MVPGVETEATVRLSQANPGIWFGPFYISAAISQVFLGVLCSQVWTYYTNFPKDPAWLKRLVAVAFCLSTFKVLHSLSIVWGTYLTHFGNWEYAAQVIWPICFQPLFTAVLSSVAQVFFVWRCYALTGWNRYFLAALITTLLAILVASVGISVQMSVDPYDRSAVVKWVLPRILMTVGLDSVITVTVLYKLLCSRRGDNPHTDILLNKLLTVIWESALPPAVVQIVALGIYYSRPGGSPNWSFLVNELISRLYIFSFLYTLNYRLDIRRFSSRAHSANDTGWTQTPALQLSEMRFMRNPNDLSTFSTFDRGERRFQMNSN